MTQHKNNTNDDGTLHSSQSQLQSQSTTINHKNHKSFDKLMQIISQSLTKSHEAISTTATIQQCYGEDAAMFADSQPEGVALIANLLDAALTYIDDDVMHQLKAASMDADDADGTTHATNQSTLQQVMTHAKRSLQRLDAATHQIQQQEHRSQQSETEDQQSAQHALQSSKLPPHITTSDLMAYYAYQMKLEIQRNLKKRCLDGRKEMEELELQVKKKKKEVGVQVNQLEGLQQDLNHAADVGSFSGVS